MRAAEACLVRGEVRDDGTKAPVSGVRVTDRSSGASGTTDEGGRFELSATADSAIHLEARGDSIEPESLTLGAGCPTELVVIPTHFVVDSDRQVTVLGRSVPRGSAVTVESREILAFPRRSGEDALRLVPGLTVVQHGSEGKGVQFFLRGFDAMHGADLEVSLGDIPLNEWSNVHAQGYVDLGFVLPEVTRRISVEKGPYTLAAGAFATAGSVRYELGVPEERRGLSAAYTLGTTNRHRAFVSYAPRRANGDDFVAFEALHDDGFGARRALDRTSTTGRVTVLRTKDFGSVELLGALSAARFDLPSALRVDDVAEGRIDRFGSYETRGRGSSARSVLGLVHNLRGRDFRWSMTTFVQLRRLELDENFTGRLVSPESSDLRRQSQSGLGYGSSATYDRRLGPFVIGELRLGLRGDRLSTERGLVEGRSSGALDEELAIDQTLVSGALGLAVRLPLDLRARLGLRADGAALGAASLEERGTAATAFSEALSPRAAVEWDPSRDVRVFASLGRGFRPPEARSLLATNTPVVGSTDDLYRGGQPRMSTSTSFEVGASYLPVPALRVRAVAFATFVERETLYDHVSGLNVELNSTERRGLEGEVLWMPAAWASITADATWVEARFAGSGRPIPFVPPVAWGVRGSVTHPLGLTAGLRLRGLAGRPLPHGASGASWATLDGSFGFGRDNYSLTLDVENVLDVAYPEGEYHFASRFGVSPNESPLPTLHFSPGPPRNARLTFALHF